MKSQKKWVVRTRAFTLSLLAIALVWLVISKSLVAYLVHTTPEMVFSISPNNTSLLTELADEKIMAHLQEIAKRNAGSGVKFSGGFVTGDKIDPQIEVWAKKILLSEPLNAHALRILGQAADSAADKAQAARYMKAAVRLSQRERLAVYWLVENSYQAGNHETMLQYADILLRTRPGLDRYVVPMLARIAETKKGHLLVAKLLAQSPPWRWRFFYRMQKGVIDSRSPLRLLLGLKDTPHPPTVREIHYYLRYLIAKKQYDLAYYSWLQFLSKEQLENAGLLFNGNFEHKPKGLPFDWVIKKQGSGTIVKIAEKPERAGQHALSIEFGYGRAEFRGVEQLLVLSPGRYRLKGRYRGNIKGQRGLQWQVECAERPGKKIARSLMFIGAAEQWKNFDFPFMIPLENCNAQLVRLVLDARTASEKLVSGTAWYDDLSISRLAPVLNALGQ